MNQDLLTIFPTFRSEHLLNTRNNQICTPTARLNGLEQNLPQKLKIHQFLELHVKYRPYLSLYCSKVKYLHITWHRWWKRTEYIQEWRNFINIQVHNHWNDWLIQIRWCFVAQQRWITHCLHFILVKNRNAQIKKMYLSINK